MEELCGQYEEAVGAVQEQATDIHLLSIGCRLHGESLDSQQSSTNLRSASSWSHNSIPATRLGGVSSHIPLSQSSDGTGRLLVIQFGGLLPTDHSPKNKHFRRSRIGTGHISTIRLHLPTWYHRCRPRPLVGPTTSTGQEVVFGLLWSNAGSGYGNVHPGQQHGWIRWLERFCIRHADCECIRSAFNTHSTSQNICHQKFNGASVSADPALVL